MILVTQMNNNETLISSYIFPTRILKILSHQLQSDFIDLPVDFEPCSHPSYQLWDHEKIEKCGKPGRIIIPDNYNLPKTMFAIVSVYVSFAEAILGARIDDDSFATEALKFAYNAIRSLSCDESVSSSFENFESNGIGSFMVRLNNFPVVWSLLKHMICPAHDLDYQNLAVLVDSSGKADASFLITKDNASQFDCEEVVDRIGSMVYCNSDISSNSASSAFVFYHALLAFAETEEQTRNIIVDCFTNFYSKSRMIGFLKMAFVHEKDAASFLAVLSILCSSEALERVAFEVYEGDPFSHKSAQMQSNWWFLGLTEQMLEPARSEDWAIYETWKQINDKLWNKVETERRLRGLDEVPFEMMLRIQSADRQVDPEQTIQALLNEDRIF